MPSRIAVRLLASSVRFAAFAVIATSPLGIVVDGQNLVAGVEITEADLQDYPGMALQLPVRAAGGFVVRFAR